MFSSDSPSPSHRLFVDSDAPNPPWKRAMDLACCIVALPFLALAAVLIALLLALASPGPLFFRQERVGYRGRRFILYKFRTMHRAADAGVHREHLSALMRSNRPLQKLDARRDTRLVAGGRLLRALGIDELPQLVNVLRGEMSIVGPRPCIPYEYDHYSPWQRSRFNSVPGLTGLWQVSGKNRTTFDEMVRLDIVYSQTRSFWLDLKIVALTFPALLRQLWDTHLQRKQRAPDDISSTGASRDAAPLHP